MFWLAVSLLPIKYGLRIDALLLQNDVYEKDP